MSERERLMEAYIHDFFSAKDKTPKTAIRAAFKAGWDAREAIGVWPRFMEVQAELAAANARITALESEAQESSKREAAHLARIAELEDVLDGKRRGIQFEFEESILATLQRQRK